LEAIKTGVLINSIKEYRQKKGLTQQELAEKADKP